MRFKQFITENKLIKSAGFVIVQDGKYVVGHATRKKWSPNFWGIPKGMIDKGETAEEAGKREVIEETGLDLNKIRGKIVPLGTSKYKPFDGVQKVLEGFLFIPETEDLTKKKLKCDSMVNLPNGDSFPEIDKFHWLDLDSNKAHYTSVELARKAKKMIDEGKV